MHNVALLWSGGIGRVWECPPVSPLCGLRNEWTVTGGHLLKDGYYNVAGDLSDPGCYRVKSGVVTFCSSYDGEESPETHVTLARLADGSKYGPSEWLPPGVTYNPADPDHTEPEKDESPVKDEHVDEARRFVTVAAIDIVSRIMEMTGQTSENIRLVFPRPSRCDRAIAERVLELLS